MIIPGSDGTQNTFVRASNNIHKPLASKQGHIFFSVHLIEYLLVINESYEVFPLTLRHVVFNN